MSAKSRKSLKRRRARRKASWDNMWFGKKKTVVSQPRNPAMYVLVRSDLGPGYQIAQAGHAIAYLSAEDALRLYQHPTMIVLNVKDEAELLSYANTQGFLFREPDLDEQATAFAVYSTGEEFSQLPLALS
jgi:hypothetical protein